MRLDILINGDRVDALAAIVHKDRAYSQGRAIAEKAENTDTATNDPYCDSSSSRQ